MSRILGCFLPLKGKKKTMAWVYMGRRYSDKET
jgi:hypothetical protein